MRVYAHSAFFRVLFNNQTELKMALLGAPGEAHTVFIGGAPLARTRVRLHAAPWCGDVNLQSACCEETVGGDAAAAAQQ